MQEALLESHLLFVSPILLAAILPDGRASVHPETVSANNIGLRGVYVANLRSFGEDNRLLVDLFLLGLEARRKNLDLPPLRLDLVLQPLLSDLGVSFAVAELGHEEADVGAEFSFKSGPLLAALLQVSELSGIDLLLEADTLQLATQF